MTRTTRQLVLLPTTGASRDWRLDDQTREVGRRGIAAAREILRLADERAAREAAARESADTASAQLARRPTQPAA